MQLCSKVEMMRTILNKTTTNHQVNFNIGVIPGVLFVLLFFIVLSQVACTEKIEDGKKGSNSINPPIPNTEAVNNRGYVEQSKIISNGEDYGVEVLAVRRTANNYMLDFRFKITDTEKAAHIMQRKIKAQLTIEKDNAKLTVPVTNKLGALRQSGKSLKENKNYFMFFANPGGHVKAGDLVTIEIEGFKAEHIIVN